MAHTRCVKTHGQRDLRGSRSRPGSRARLGDAETRMVSGPATDEKTASAVRAMIRQQAVRRCRARRVALAPHLRPRRHQTGHQRTVRGAREAPAATEREMLTKKFWPLEEGRAPQLTPKQQTNKAIHLLGSAANERTMDNVHTHRSRNTLPYNSSHSDSSPRPPGRGRGRGTLAHHFPRSAPHLRGRHAEGRRGCEGSQRANRARKRWVLTANLGTCPQKHHPDAAERALHIPDRQRVGSRRQRRLLDRKQDYCSQIVPNRNGGCESQPFVLVRGTFGSGIVCDVRT